ncbi:MAG: AIM24 family protein [Syntrophobacteraceae bacterium]|jgi:uncharacterized protein (TIGR00266 family)|nr:AIM24 family protein [Syntrophobacteraceae bacterium]
MRILERKGSFYEISGDNLEMLRIKVGGQFRLFAEAGKMIYTRGSVRMESRMPCKSGGGLMDKLIGAGKRMLAGESLFFTYYEGEGEAGFAGDFPGRILAVGVQETSIIAQRDAFIAAVGDIDISIALQKRIGGALFGGEGFILEKISGDGVVFIHAGGDLFSFHLQAGETMLVDTGSVVAWEETVAYDVQTVGSVRSALFGGEGIFLTTLTGPGQVVIQTMTLAKLRRQIAYSGTGTTEKGSSVLGTAVGIGGIAAGAGTILGSLLGGEDKEG